MNDFGFCHLYQSHNETQWMILAVGIFINLITQRKTKNSQNHVQSFICLRHGCSNENFGQGKVYLQKYLVSLCTVYKSKPIWARLENTWINSKWVCYVTIKHIQSYVCGPNDWTRRRHQLFKSIKCPLIPRYHRWLFCRSLWCSSFFLQM